MCVYSEVGSRVLPLSGASSFLAWLSFFVRRTFMYLLYADDSGVISDPNVKYSVLAGFATFEILNIMIMHIIQ